MMKMLTTTIHTTESADEESAHEEEKEGEGEALSLQKREYRHAGDCGACR